MKAWLAPALIALALTLPVAAQQKTAPPVAPKPAEPLTFPDADKMAERKKEAEGRQLFASDTLLEFTLTADFKAVNKDRNPDSKKVFPATMTVNDADGKPTTFPLNIRT